jgi:hypothetical protein
MYVSFKPWLDHLQQVMDQKQSRQWKIAVLDCPALSCHGAYPDASLPLEFTVYHSALVA